MQTSSGDEFKRYEICISGTQQLFIDDALLFLSVSRLLSFQHRPIYLKPQHTPMNTNKYNSSDLVELLQQSAVEHLPTYRQLTARDFGSVYTLSQQTLRRCTRTNVATISGVYSCLHRTYTRCCMLVA